MSRDRRSFLTSTPIGTLIDGCAESSRSSAAGAPNQPGDDDEATPVEDLLRAGLRA
jgi:hypothetical protein